MTIELYFFFMRAFDFLLVILLITFLMTFDCLQVSEQEPSVMWLSGLHIPESYLTALVQATCRKNGWPLDKSTLYTSVTTYKTQEDVTERAHQGRHWCNTSVKWII